MKRNIALILVASMFLSGCSYNPNKETTVNNNQIKESTQRAPEDTVSSRWTTENWLALYQDQIIFQNPTLGAGLYQLDAGKETAPICILENGEPIGIYGSILYACDYSKNCYMAMDLAKGNEWISLQAWNGNAGSAVSDEKNLYYSGMSLDEDGHCYGFFVDVVELDSLKSKRIAINKEIRFCFVEKEYIYYIQQGESTYELCRADLFEKKEELLCEVDPNVQLYKAGTHIFIYSQNVNPRLYDMESRTVQEVTTFQNGQNDIKIIEDIAYGTCKSYEPDREWIYDIAAGTELTKEESILNGWSVFAEQDDVLFCKDSEKEQYYRFLVNGIKFEADMSQLKNRDSFSHITANEQWGVLLTKYSLILVNIENNQVVYQQWNEND